MRLKFIRCMVGAKLVQAAMGGCLDLCGTNVQ